MVKAVSEKSTKTEVLEAYNQLLAKMKEQKAADQSALKKEVEAKEVVKAASANTTDNIVGNIADLKLHVVKSMDSLEERLIAEYRKLSDLRQAIGIAGRDLADIHEISVEAESLFALVQAQKDKKDSFEAEIDRKKADFDDEMATRKAQWKKEQEEYELAKKERDGQLKKERQREEEDYTYTLQLARKKDKDTYEARKANLDKELVDKRAALEEELSEREEVVSLKEKELADLEAKVETFPKEIEKAIKDTEKAVTDRIETRYKHQFELLQKEIDGEKKLKDQMIAALELKIKEQDELVRQLTQKANESVQQVQAIAIKAIEGAAIQRTIIEKAKEG